MTRYGLLLTILFVLFGAPAWGQGPAGAGKTTGDQAGETEGSGDAGTTDDATKSAEGETEGTLTDVGSQMAEDPLGFAGKLFDTAKEKLIENGPGWVMKAVIFLLIIFVFRIIASILARVTKRALDMSKLDISELLRGFFVNIVRKVTFFAGLLIGIGTLGIDIGPVLAGLGVAGFVIGFALQDTLSNFSSGIMILLYRPYDVGDVIDAGGVKGKVEDMSMVSTTIVTPDNQVMIVPNGSIWGGVIQNVTARDTRRVDLTFGIGYEDDIDKAEDILQEVVMAHPKVLDNPGITIKLSNLGDSSVDFVVRPWCKTSDYWDVYWDLTKSVKQRFDQEGISIPYPQRDIHVYQASA